MELEGLIVSEISQKEKKTYSKWSNSCVGFREAILRTDRTKQKQRSELGYGEGAGGQMEWGSRLEEEVV